MVLITCRKKELIARSELVLPWRPFYRLVKECVYSHHEQHGLVLLPPYVPLSVCLSVWSVSTHIMNSMVLSFSRCTYLSLSVCLSVCLECVYSHHEQHGFVLLPPYVPLSVCLSVWSVSTHIMNNMVLCFSRRTYLSLSVWSVSTHIMNSMVLFFSRRT